MSITLRSLLEHQQLYLLREHETERQHRLEIKLDTDTSRHEADIRANVAALGEQFEKGVAALPSNAALQEMVNNYFVGLYTRL